MAKTCPSQSCSSSSSSSCVSVLGVRFEDSGFRYVVSASRVSGFGILFSGFGFGVWGLGFGV